jgi:hypothetical protein
MAARLGPIEVYCDAPPYSIIQACSRIGVQQPEDVRWCKLSHFIQADDGRREGFPLQTWKNVLGMHRAGRSTCSCGHALPILEKCTFTFITGREVSYFIGQCKRCRTVFWDDVSSPVLH